MITAQRPRALRAGPGRQARCCTTSTSTSQGINARLQAEKSNAEAVHARRRVRGQRARRPDLRPGRRRRGAPLAAALGALRKRLGDGAREDGCSTTSPSTSTPTRRRRSPSASPYEEVRRTRTGNAIARRRLLTSRDAAARRRAARRARTHRWASNFLIVGGSAPPPGHPLFVAGPQIGYFYPGLTLEADLKGPGFEARGATAPGRPGQHPDRPRPGLRLEPHLGRLGPDRPVRRDAVRRLDARSTSTRASAARWARVDAGMIKGAGPRRVPHDRPRPGDRLRARSAASTVAISRKRASFGQDILWQLPFRD